MDRGRIAVAAAFAIALVALRVALPEPETVAMIHVPQGISFHVVEGERVFLLREGNVLTAFLGRSTQSGEPIVYCPREAAFVAPTDASLWTARGEWVGGPAPRDLDRVATRVDEDLVVHMDVDAVTRSRGRSEGRISGEAGDRYARFRAGDDTAGFCLGPLPRP